jgi:hypothetical protein
MLWERAVPKHWQGQEHLDKNAPEKALRQNAVGGRWGKVLRESAVPKRWQGQEYLDESAPDKVLRQDTVGRRWRKALYPSAGRVRSA